MIRPYQLVALLVFLVLGTLSVFWVSTPEDEGQGEPFPVSNIEPCMDFACFKEGRPCAQVALRCLPESRDRRWQEQNLSDGLDTWELTEEVIQKQKEIVQRWRDEEEGKTKEKDMQVSAISEAFYDRVEAKRFLIGMEQDLAEEFPGFWRETPKPVRYRWIRRATNKAKVFGYDSKGSSLMVRLCARIGLDFNKDPKWEHITRFVAKDAKMNLASAIDYIDWTVFGKKYDWTGTRITDWSMHRTLEHLPYPKTPYPRLTNGVE